MVGDVQAELPGPSGDDGGAHCGRGTYDHPALGATVRAGVRKARAALCRSVGTSWRIDETYIKIKGNWVYLYRGVDTEGQTIDFFLSERRDIAAAKRFLQQASEKRGSPRKSPLMAMRPLIERLRSYKKRTSYQQISSCGRTAM